MTFDPFFDFESRGYLRNRFGEKDLAIVRRLEHSSFVQGVEEAFANLSRVDRLGYGDVLATHKTLFGHMYPWAGQDRGQTAPNLAVSRGPVLFAHPEDAPRAVEHALRLADEPGAMRERPGEIMGFLAYAHPFLDGNGRTIMVVHTELAHRAGVGIAWDRTDKDAYLAALTRELQSPGRGHLDAYLKPFVGQTIGREGLSQHVVGARGIDGVRADAAPGKEVSGNFDEPGLQARYRQQEEQRQASYSARQQRQSGKSAVKADLDRAQSGSGKPGKGKTDTDRGRSK